MTIHVMKRYRKSLLMMAVLAMILLTSGCFSLRNPFAKRPSTKGVEVVPFANTEAIQLSADDIANILLGIGGFSPDVIMNIGGDLHQALMLKGGAEIHGNGRILAQMRVASEQIQIVAPRGYFIYDVKTHRFILGGQQSTQMQQQAPSMQPQMQQQMPLQQQMPVQQPQSMQPYPNYPTKTPQYPYGQ